MNLCAQCGYVSKSKDRPCPMCGGADWTAGEGMVPKAKPKASPPPDSSPEVVIGDEETPPEPKPSRPSKRGKKRSKKSTAGEGGE